MVRHPEWSDIQESLILAATWAVRAASGRTDARTAATAIRRLLAPIADGRGPYPITQYRRSEDGDS